MVFDFVIFGWGGFACCLLCGWFGCRLVGGRVAVGVLVGVLEFGFGLALYCQFVVCGSCVVWGARFGCGGFGCGGFG